MYITSSLSRIAFVSHRVCLASHLSCIAFKGLMLFCRDRIMEECGESLRTNLYLEFDRDGAYVDVTFSIHPVATTT